VSNAVGKKFQAFKFNLTLNKKAPLNSSKGVSESETQQAFYQAAQPLESVGQEDNDAIRKTPKMRDV
jgi:hypothetical protein